MSRTTLLGYLIPLLGLAACGPDQPTGPSAPAEEVSATAAGVKVVNSVTDPGNGVCNATQCTLREAINDPASTAITFAAGLTGPITLAKPASGGGELLINKALSITGPSSGIVIRRRSTDPIFRIVRIGLAGNVTLTNITIRNGKTDGAGGGITNNGTLSLVSSTVSGNAAHQGGAIYNHGPLTLTRSTLSNNSADFGGGIDNHGRLTIVRSTIVSNAGSGSGIYNHNNQRLSITTTTIGQNSGRGLVNDGGTVEITNSTIAGNNGGGIFQVRGSASLDRVRVVDNVDIGSFGSGWGAGIWLRNSQMTLRRSTIARNSADRGGGIFNGGSELTILSSVIYANSATEAGGGIDNEEHPVRVGSSLILTNSTVSGNSAERCGGIYNDAFLSSARLTLANSTVAFNSAQLGGGICVGDESYVNFTNSLVAGNSAPSAPDVWDSPGAYNDINASFSLIGDGTGSSITNTNGNLVGNVSPYSSPIDPKLGALANNGGLTRTHALLEGSPAIDAASAAACPATDQRGVTRPQGAGCDIGSYERVK